VREGGRPKESQAGDGSCNTKLRDVFKAHWAKVHLKLDGGYTVMVGGGSDLSFVEKTECFKHPRSGPLGITPGQCVGLDMGSCFQSCEESVLEGTAPSFVSKRLTSESESIHRHQSLSRQLLV